MIIRQARQHFNIIVRSFCHGHVYFGLCSCTKKGWRHLSVKPSLYLCEAIIYEAKILLLVVPEYSTDTVILKSRMDISEPVNLGWIVRQIYRAILTACNPFKEKKSYIQIFPITGPFDLKNRGLTQPLFKQLKLSH